MRIRFLEIAQIELDEAIQYYRHESPGLDKAFLNEILKTLDRIAQYPTAWHPLSENTRRCQLQRFPYGIIYHANQNEILVVAIANLHRKPGYWADRISTS